jgi:hypothetical protein
LISYSGREVINLISKAASSLLFLLYACVCFAQTASIPNAGHVVLIIEENHGFSEVYPNGMPWLVSQATSTGAIATNFTSPINNTGSLGAYLWLSSGGTESQFGCTGNGCSKPIADDNIFRELDMRGMTWKVYAQSLPSVGYTGDGPSPYLKRHNPAVWYSSVLDKPTDLQRVVPFTQFSQDLASNNLPEYSVVIPNAMNDAHDGTLAQADAFLKNNMASVLQSTYFKPGGDGLLLLTFDECGGGENSTCGAHIFSALLGPLVKHGYLSGMAYSHSDMLRTIEDVLGLQPYFGAVSSAHDMADFFVTTSAASGSCGAPNSPGALLCSPLPAQTYGSPVLIDGAGKGASGSVNHLELWIDGGKIGNYFSNQMSTSVALENGPHAATLVEIDSAGTLLKSTPTNFTVGCAAPASAGARLCSPVAGQTYSSSVQVTGSGTCANAPADHLELWIDGHKIGNYAGGTISTTVTSTSGAHAATLVAVDAKGNYWKSAPVNFNVR